MYHISLYFDIKTEAHLREYIRKVAEATGNTYMLDADVPPHITLAAFECEKEEELIQCLERLLCSIPPGMLCWVSVGTFLPGVIFLQPVLNEYLQELIQKVHDCLQGIEGIKLRPCYRPYSWLPHSTVAKRLAPIQLQQAFEVLQREFAAFQGKVVRIGVAKMNPHEEIMSLNMERCKKTDEM